MPGFNLVDERWIPCAERAGGTPHVLSLRAVFAEAPLLANVADPSPAVTISLYRLLLAVLHRSLEGPSGVGEWKSIFTRGRWDLDRINAYLDKWNDKFDLFDARYPFYQTPDLSLKEAPAASQLAQERASDRNRSLLFDHTSGDPSLTPAQAARYLVAMHNFAVGGLISLPSGEPIANKTTAKGPLLGAAVTIARGETLFETLMLNWVRYSRGDQIPFPFRGDDKPAWEREDGATPDSRLPDGYVDLLTWQSRRILMTPKVMPDGETRVSGAVLMKGYQFAESFEQWSSETMVAYRKNTTVKNGLPWFAIKLDPDRVVWRDSQTLIQSVADERQRPKVMDWLDTLVNKKAIGDHGIVPLEIYGLIPDQANILDWRRESLPLPVNLLEQREAKQHLLQRLQEAISLAESIARLFDATLIDVGRGGRLQSPIWVLCEGLLAGLSEREPKREDCATLARSFGAGPRYWSQLDAPFRAFILGLADTGDVVEEGGATRYGMRALRSWADEVKRIARDVFSDVIDDLDTSARMLYASATAEQRFEFLLAALMAPFRPAPETTANVPEGVTP